MRTAVLFVVAAVGALGAFGSTGCASVGGSAVRTGPRYSPISGPIAIYAGPPPSGARQVGLVEVHGNQTDGAIEELLPLFAAKVAQLGGDTAVLDDVRAHFDVLPRVQGESYSTDCGYMSMCNGTRTYTAADEVMTVTLSGRAFRTGEGKP